MSQDESQKKGQLAKIILTLTFVGVLVATILGYQKYQEIFGVGVPKAIGETTIEIPTNTSFEEVVDILKNKNLVAHEKAFRWVAEKMKYPRNPMRSGKFKIQPGWSNYELIQHLRGGKQETVKLVFNSAWTVKNVAAKVAQFIEPDSSDLATLFMNEQFIADLGFTPATLMSLFIPNTYDFFWNTSPAKFMERMKKEHASFWAKNNRAAKAKQLELTPEEVYILASIVERETLQNGEKKRMAGVYYNRLKTKGWRLEADPTVKFAIGDFALRRILNKHLAYDSPYNTYKYGGLPPGPISMASIASIDAVLNVESHDYMFFCAKGDGSGYHNFAKSLKQHNRNAAIYRANMRKSGAWD